MEKPILKIGDVVKLKSGSPEMTVTGKKDSYGQLYVSLFDMNKYELLTYNVDCDSLEFIR